MSKSVQEYWIFMIFICGFLFTGIHVKAQEVYFAEDPPMVLDGKAKQIPGFVVEYSAKNNGFILLQLFKNKELLVGKGVFVVKKRGSNTAAMSLRMLDADKQLEPSTDYEYRLTLFENSSTKEATSKETSSMISTASFAPLSKSAPERKKVGKTTIVQGVKVF